MENVRRRANGGALAVIIAAVAFALAVLFAGAFGTPVKAEGTSLAPITVQLSVPKGENVPINATINYTVTKNNDGVASITHGTNTYNVSDDGPDVTIASAKFNTDQKNKDADDYAGTFVSGANANYYEKEIAVTTGDLTNVKSGIYHYTVTASQPADNSLEGLKIKETTIDMYLYVTSENTVSAIYYDRTGAEKATEVTFNGGDVAGKLGRLNATYKTSTLGVKKVVTGNMANSTEKFDFTFNISSNNAKKIAYTITENRGQEGALQYCDLTKATGATKATGEITNIRLGNRDYVTFYGLTDSDEVKFKENRPGNYTVSYYDGDQDALPSENVKPIEPTNGEIVVSSSDFSSTNDNGATIQRTVINQSDVTPPTGLLYNPMTYIILIAAAAVLGTLLYRRKHAYDDED